MADFIKSGISNLAGASRGSTVKSFLGSGTKDFVKGMGGNIFSSILGGLGNSLFGSGTGAGTLWAGIAGAAGNYLSGKDIKEGIREQGLESRRTSAFEADLKDYFEQKNKNRKRVALDTYGQFSLMNRWAPNATPAPALDQPAKPDPNKY